MSGMVAAVGATALSAGASIYGANKGAKASAKAAEAQAAAQMAALNYQKETERLPQAFREGGLQGYGAEFGLEMQNGRVVSDGSTVSERAMSSPYYQQVMGTRQMGEEGIMRNQAMSGGLRSGNTQDALYQYNQQLGERAFSNSYDRQMAGLEGLSQLPSNANQIAATQAGIGTSQAGGILGAGQAWQQGYQGVGDAIQSGISMYGQGKKEGWFEP